MNFDGKKFAKSKVQGRAGGLARARRAVATTAQGNRLITAAKCIAYSRCARQAIPLLAIDMCLHPAPLAKRSLGAAARVHYNGRWWCAITVT